MHALIASIPSPSNGAFDVGPLTIHMYGLTLLVAILAATWLTAVRWSSVGGDPDLVLRVAVWGVAAGVVGARALPRPHLVERGARPEVEGRLRDLERRPRRVGRDPLGVLVGCYIVKRAGASATLMMDAAAPGLLLAQGIGRIGN